MGEGPVAAPRCHPTPLESAALRLPNELSRLVLPVVPRKLDRLRAGELTLDTPVRRLRSPLQLVDLHLTLPRPRLVTRLITLPPPSMSLRTLVLHLVQDPTGIPVRLLVLVV